MIVRALCLGIGLAGAACSGGMRRPEPGAVVARPVEASMTPGEITMERGPCYRSCPIYLVRISPEGDVHFDGRSHVSATGPARGRATRPALDSLWRFIDQGGFDRFDASYTHKAPACGAYTMDLPTVTVWVNRAGATRRVTHDYGCSGAPAELRELHRRIDTVAGTARWIEGMEKR